MLIVKVESFTAEIFWAVSRLVPQLGSHKLIPTIDELTSLISSEALMSAAIKIARDAGANEIALTSNSQRVEANLLYQKMGLPSARRMRIFISWHKSKMGGSL